MGDKSPKPKPAPKPNTNDLINRGALPDKPSPTGPRPGPKRYAKGGMVRGSGCATKGRGRGRFV